MRRVDLADFGNIQLAMQVLRQQQVLEGYLGRTSVDDPDREGIRRIQ